MRRTRGGFTLIELMVVIGIILVLVSIVVIGLRHVNYTAARHETVAELKICSDMLKEYENINNLARIEEVYTGSARQVQTLGPPAPPILMLPVYFDQNPATSLDISAEIKNGDQGESAVQTDDVFDAGHTTNDMGDKSAPRSARYQSRVVVNTQMVMYLLLRDPKNRATVAGVPAKRILEGQVTIPGQPAQPFPMDYAVVLDGWGNPIIFVPRGGLHIIATPSGTPQEFVVRSSGTTLVGLTPPLGPNDHPFFASAGQDGAFSDFTANKTPSDFATDNIYSFQD